MKSSMLTTFLFATTVFTVVQARAFPSISMPDSFGTPDSLPSLQTTARKINSGDTAIKFATLGGSAELFINGMWKAETKGPLQVAMEDLKQNDVIAFKCIKTSPRNKKAGLMANIIYKGEIYRTGVHVFTSRSGFSKWKKWEQKSWNAVKEYKNRKTGKRHGFCHWKKAIKIVTRAKKFDKPASFIWKTTGEHKNKPERTVFIRFVIGGENCPAKPTKAKSDEDDEDDDGKGERTKGDDDGSEDGKSKRKKDMDGDDDDDDDAKSKRSKNKGEDDDDDDDDGKGKRRRNKGDRRNDDDDDGEGKQRSSKGEDDDDDDDDAKSKRRKNKGDDDDEDEDDGDGKAKRRKDKGDDDDDGKSKRKKDEHDDDDGDDSDDDKNKPSGRVPQPKGDDAGKNGKPGTTDSLSGQSDGSKPDGFCACEPTPRKGGECYDIEEPSANSGRCKPRPCEPKFECVASGAKMCVKRRGGSKVIMVSPNKCMAVSSDEEMLLPYEG